MTATNHALAGALIGLAISNPIIAVPLAFISHFLLDSAPHFGPGTNAEKWMRSRRFHAMLGIEMLLCFIIVLVLGITQPVNWVIAAICAFAATSPDLTWIANFVRTNKDSQPQHKLNAFQRFHAKIQWFERPAGAAVELVFFIVLLTLFLRQL